MFTAADAMRQASMTAREYATEGKKAFEDIFNCSFEKNPQAAATFMAGFMQAAAMDFHAWAVSEKLNEIVDQLSSIQDILDQG